MKLSVALLFCFIIFSSRGQVPNNLLDSLENALRLSKNDSDRVRLLDELSNNCEIEDILKFAEPEVTIAEQKLKTLNKESSLYNYYSVLLSDALSNIGYYYKFNGNALLALQFYEKSLNVKRSISDKKGEAVILNNIAVIYYDQGKIDKALEFNAQSLKLREALNDKSGVAISLHNIATIYEDQGELTKALEYNLISLEIKEKIQDKEGIGTTLNGIGSIYYALGDTAKAIHYCKKSINIYKEFGDPRSLAAALNNLGYIYLMQGKLDESFYYLDSSRIIRERIDHKQGLASSYENIGTYYFFKGDYKTSIKYSLATLRLGDSLGYPTIIRNAALSLKKAYQNINQPIEALKMYELYILMKDSVNNIETKKAALKTQIRYEFDKKEALLLEQQNQERTIAKEREEKQKIIIWAGFSGLIIVAIFLVFVLNRLKLTRNQNRIIKEQKHLVEVHQKEIIDSINYAKRIQYALLASEDLLNEHLPEHFVLFKPKDVVSGDFYWGTPVEDGFILVTADCTGHGVPGAFMSLLNISKLNQIVNEKKITRPDVILNQVREEIILALNPPGSNEISKDGMDAVVCKLNLAKQSLQFASANNSFYIIRNNTLLTCKADKMPVGKGHDDSVSFTFNEIKILKGDAIYIFTDGLADQFGGPMGKKFKYKQLENLLLELHQKPMASQKEEIELVFEKWKGNLEQVDDVCLIGLKINA